MGALLQAVLLGLGEGVGVGAGLHKLVAELAVVGHPDPAFLGAFVARDVRGWGGGLGGRRGFDPGHDLADEGQAGITIVIFPTVTVGVLVVESDAVVLTSMRIWLIN